MQETQDEVEDKTMKVLFFIFLVFVALLVILTCIWKIVKLIALYKMESRIEELEQSLAGVGGLEGLARGTVGGTQPKLIVSPKEARTLRRLSILAGFDKSWSNLGFSRRKSGNSSGSTLKSALLSTFKKGSSTINIVNDTSTSHLNGTSEDLRAENQNPNEINLTRFSKSAESLPNGKANSIKETCQAHVHYHHPQQYHQQPKYQHQSHHHVVESRQRSPSPILDANHSPVRIASTSFTSCAIHGHRRPSVDESNLMNQASQLNNASPLSSSWSQDEEDVTSSPAPPCNTETMPEHTPHWVECTNPYHVHPRPMIIPDHIHQCHCGASFPALDSTKSSCNTDARRESCRQACSLSQPNIVEPHHSSGDENCYALTPPPRRTTTILSSSSGSHRRSLQLPDFDKIEVSGLREPLYSQCKKNTSNSWTCAQNGSKSLDPE
ncbi:hypothetical protein TCAL_16729 [Tigriopus californicus]|uniref:Uncharacterized protein n=1 Tax=Tigriopus californicus TaxID=6832 RepID=A0A553PMQ1_TIGCA|nr:hypothetical protein TCAL_16729 [Tigriopus californicus]